METNLELDIPVVNLQLYRGDDKTFEVDVFSGDMPFEFSDGIIAMDILPMHGSVVSLPVSDICIKGNSLLLTFSSAFTTAQTWQQGKYDVQFTSSDGKVQTLFRGSIKILEDITK